MSRRTIHAQISTILDTKSTDVTEDTYFVHHNGETITVMVADGAPQRLKTTGSLLPMLQQYGQDTAPGRYAAYLTRDVTAEVSTNSPDTPLADICLVANQRLRKELEAIYGEITVEAVMAKEPSLTKLTEDPRFVRLILPICCITMARVDLYNGRLSYAHGGDTALFLLYKDGRTVQITPDQMGQHDDKMRAEIQAIVDETGKRDRETLLANWDRFKSVDVYNGIYHNYEDENGAVDPAVGVGVINGLPQFENYLVTSEVSIDDLEGILVTSDGFFWPSALGETEEQAAVRVNEMGQMVRQQGLAGYMKSLREEESSDADGSKYLRFGSHDDATAVWLQLS